MRRFLDRIGVFACGLLCWSIGGWGLLWGAKIPFLPNETRPDVVFESKGFMFRMDEVYYGFCMMGKPFDSPVLSWLLLVGAIILIVVAFLPWNRYRR